MASKQTTGQYQIGFCDGTTSRDATRCAPCNYTSCRPMHVLVNQCTGRGTVDLSKCVPCTDPSTAGCGFNQYMHQLCSATSLYDGVCRNCELSCIGASANSSLAPTGQFKLIPCTGTTSSNLVCANCSQNCALGYYVTNLCNGTGTSDATTCAECTCPAGSYAPSNTCTGSTTRNTLQCVPCTNASSCPENHYLSGTCSTFSNPTCTPCRSGCKSAEVEAQACANGKNRVCLPDFACFQVFGPPLSLWGRACTDKRMDRTAPRARTSRARARRPTCSASARPARRAPRVSTSRPPAPPRQIPSASAAQPPSARTTASTRSLVRSGGARWVLGPYIPWCVFFMKRKNRGCQVRWIFSDTSKDKGSDKHKTGHGARRHRAVRRHH